MAAGLAGTDHVRLPLISLIAPDARLNYPTNGSALRLNSKSQLIQVGYTLIAGDDAPRGSDLLQIGIRN